MLARPPLRRAATPFAVGGLQRFLIALIVLAYAKCEGGAARAPDDRTEAALAHATAIDCDKIAERASNVRPLLDSNAADLS